MTNEERIKADARTATDIRYKDNDAVNFEYIEYEEGYIAGATAVHDKARVLVDALEAIAGISMPVPNKADMIEIAKKHLEQWKGKEVELKEPDKNYSLSTEEKKKLLANKIEARMKEAGLQRQEFADLMGTQPSTITRWLSGEHNFQIDTLFEIEKQLNISLFNY